MATLQRGLAAPIDTWNQQFTFVGRYGLATASYMTCPLQATYTIVALLPPLSRRVKLVHVHWFWWLVASDGMLPISTAKHDESYEYIATILCE